MMLRCRLSPPPAFTVHSYPISAVNLPGSLYLSAIAMVFSQALTIHFGFMISAGSFPFDCRSMASRTAAWLRFSSPLFMASLQRLIVGSASISGLPARISLMVPIPSE